MVGYVEVFSIHRCPARDALLAGEGLLGHAGLHDILVNFPIPPILVAVEGQAGGK